MHIEKLIRDRQLGLVVYTHAWLFRAELRDNFAPQPVVLNRTILRADGATVAEAVAALEALCQPVLPLAITRLSRPPQGGRCCGVNGLTAERITAILGFEPVGVRPNSDGKVDAEWCFRVGNDHCAVWSYKGAGTKAQQWSFGGSVAVARALFGEAVAD